MNNIIIYIFFSLLQVWQSSHRPVKQPGIDVDGVDIVAIMKRDGKKVRRDQRSLKYDRIAGLL